MSIVFRNPNRKALSRENNIFNGKINCQWFQFGNFLLFVMTGTVTKIIKCRFLFQNYKHLCFPFSYAIRIGLY